MRYFNWPLATDKARSFSERFDEAWPPYPELESSQLVFSIRVGCSLDSASSLHQTLLHDCHRYDPPPGEPQPSARSKQLIEAYRVGRKRVVKLLLAMGMDPSAVVNGSTPLFAACVEGHVDVIKALIASGANVNERDCRPLFWVWMSRCADVADTLIAGGASAYHANVKRQKLCALLSRGALVDKATNDGHTPLDGAPTHGNLETCKVLLTCVSWKRSQVHYHGEGGVLDVAVGYQVVKLKRLLQRPPMLSDLRWTLEVMCNYDPSRRVHITFAVG